MLRVEEVENLELARKGSTVGRRTVLGQELGLRGLPTKCGSEGGVGLDLFSKRNGR